MKSLIIRRSDYVATICRVQVRAMVRVLKVNLSPRVCQQRFDKQADTWICLD